MRRLIANHLEREGDAVKAYRDEAAGHLPFSTDASTKTAR
jgi:predicted N-acyltransferase